MVIVLYLFDSLKNIHIKMNDNIQAWHDFYDDVNPQDLPLPEPYDKVNEMLALIILKGVRPDKLVPAVRVCFEAHEKIFYILFMTHLFHLHRLSSHATWTSRLWSLHRSIWELRSVTVHRKFR